MFLYYFGKLNLWRALQKNKGTIRIVPLLMNQAASLLDGDPHFVDGAVGQRGRQLPRPHAQGFCVQVEVPFAGRSIGQAELVARRRSICRRRIDHRIGIHGAGILRRLQGMHAGGDRAAAASGLELHWDRAAEFERPQRISKAPARAVAHFAADG